MAPSPGTLTLIEWDAVSALSHLNHVCFGRCGSSAYRVSAAGSALDNLAMTGFHFTNDLAELTLNKLLPYKLPLRSPYAQWLPLQFKLRYRSPLFELQR